MESKILIFLVTLQGVWSWNVVAKDRCALKGASVVIECQYDYNLFYIVTSVQWSKRLHMSGNPKLVPLSQISSVQGRFKYVGDKSSNCGLQINDVQDSDKGLYVFEFWTTLGGPYTSEKPAQLTVSDLVAVVHPSTVTEGDKVSLTCKSDCLTPVKPVWFRDGKFVSRDVFLARGEDGGRYYCAVSGQARVRSASVVLNVRYAPRRVLLSVNQSPEVIKGEAVTFTCSSDANPSVTQGGYSLYKDGRPVSTGWTYTISHVQPSHSGLYHCQAWNNISRSGTDLFNSTEVHLDVQYPPENISVSMTSPHVTEGSGMNLTCSSSANPAAVNYTWFRRISSPNSSSLLQVGSGQVLSLPSVEASHTGLYLCQARNTLGENNSTEVLLTMAAENSGIQSVLVLAGVGVFLLLLLLFALLFFWRKKMTYGKKRQGSLSTSVTEDPLDNIYMNTSALSSSPRSKTGSRSKRDANMAQTSQGDDVTYTEVTIKPQGDDVTYTEVTIKPRNPHPQLLKNNNNRAVRDSGSRTGENEDSVIYSTVTRSR
ncbi:B-cell receptor CD22-like [Xyrichtys novacula]|uniref:B-cell receptor CD22-like n=1 Tax=Xyrichtys novacula TaxID=13765 RepID=A0AAV1FKQ0_XYRNO|nr:B-cell receptor CD22-like [Xyrichtys novacula]